MMREARSVLASSPLKLSSDADWMHFVPDHTDSIGTRCFSPAAQANRHSGANIITLRIHPLLFLDDPAHLELAVLDRKGEPPLNQVERVLAELLVAPAPQ